MSSGSTAESSWERFPEYFSLSQDLRIRLTLDLGRTDTNLILCIKGLLATSIKISTVSLFPFRFPSCYFNLIFLKCSYITQIRTQNGSQSAV